jgi:hypothetical protein
MQAHTLLGHQRDHNTRDNSCATWLPFQNLPFTNCPCTSCPCESCPLQQPLQQAAICNSCLCNGDPNNRHQGRPLPPCSGAALPTQAVTPACPESSLPRLLMAFSLITTDLLLAFDPVFKATHHCSALAQAVLHVLDELAALEALILLGLGRHQALGCLTSPNLAKSASAPPPPHLCSSPNTGQPLILAVCPAAGAPTQWRS